MNPILEQFRDLNFLGVSRNYLNPDLPNGSLKNLKIKKRTKQMDRHHSRTNKRGRGLTEEQR